MSTSVVFITSWWIVTATKNDDLMTSRNHEMFFFFAVVLDQGYRLKDELYVDAYNCVLCRFCDFKQSVQCSQFSLFLLVFEERIFVTEYDRLLLHSFSVSQFRSTSA